MSRTLLRTRIRRAVAVIASTAVIISGLTAFEIATSAEPAVAISAGEFQPGNIISDQVFFNSGTMNAAQIQSFLNTKVKSCRSGYTCLKDYRQDTFDRVADPMCQGYRGAGSESAATIIEKVAKSCGINPQVLIVLLQKEQGLVTDTWPVTRQYRSATGYGCPDTAACDEQYYGFYNQVYMAAWAFKRYTQPEGTGSGTQWSTRFDLRYPVGKTSDVYFHPSTSCGTSKVLIENQATHALYIYTPYQPNAAALSAGYGTGDSCSAYGNRNFFLYFGDWFGDPHGFAVVNAIGAAWTALGAAQGVLGSPTSAEACGIRDNGCWQQFQNGRIYWSAASGAWAVTGAIQSRWIANGSEWGGLGYPTGPETCGLTNGGCSQQFQGGKIHWSATSGAWATTNAIGNRWSDLSAEAGGLGYPIAAETCGIREGGCWQQFQGGRIYWSAAAGAWAITGGIGDRWIALGSEWGGLGYPTSGESCDLKNGGCWQQYQGGQIHWSATSGAWATTGAIGDRWKALGAQNGGLGYPTNGESCDLKNGGCWQQYQGGQIHWSATSGAWATTGAIGDRWKALDAQNGQLGYPTGSELCAIRDGGCWQQYQGGRVYWSAATGAHAVKGGIGNRWITEGSEWGRLSFPTGEETCGLTDGGCWQSFAGGAVYWSSATGAWAVAGSIRDRWLAQGGESGPLGFPTGAERTLPDGRRQQAFEGGLLVS